MRPAGLLILAVLSAWAAAARADGPAVWIELRTGEDQPPAVRLAAAPNQTLSLEFVNSIYLAPVRETYAINAVQGLILVRIESPCACVFEYYGLEAVNSHNLHRPVGDLSLLSSDYTHHRLKLGDRSVALKDMVGPGERITLKVVVR
ncbi:MAG: hypothetical protein AB1641_29425 [Thermodesulfobacteriota bacterium]